MSVTLIVSRIKALLGFDRLTDARLITRISAVLKGMAGNPAFSRPPVDLAVFKTAFDNYAASVTIALDGSKTAIAERIRNRGGVTAMARSLARYVEDNCNGDMATFLSSGFEAASTTRATPQPLPPARIDSVDHGNTGQLLVSIQPLKKARLYEVRYSPVGASGTPVPWANAVAATAKGAMPINNLTPGTTYGFQVRAFGSQGYTGWSDSVNRMCV